MANGDTIKLLKECDAGTKTAVTSMREVLDRVKSAELLAMLNESTAAHEKLGDKAHELLGESNEDGKEPAPMAKAMSWMKINFKMLENGSDHTAAGLIIDGCSMGIKQVSEYINQYPEADKKALDLAHDIIEEEEKLAQGLRAFL